MTASIARAGRARAVFSGPQPPRPIIPDVGDPDVFVDSQDPDRRWYVPMVAAVVPAPDVAPATSPFRYTFVTHADQTISAAVHITVETSAPPGVGAGWRPVPLIDVSAFLVIPYRSETDGTTVHVTPDVPGTVTRAAENRFTIEFPIPGDLAARAAYGNLSMPGFQDEPARVRLSYSVDGYSETFTGRPGGGFTLVTSGALDLPPLPIEIDPHPDPEPDPVVPATLTSIPDTTTVVTQPPVTETITKAPGIDTTLVVTEAGLNLELQRQVAVKPAAMMFAGPLFISDQGDTGDVDLDVSIVPIATAPTRVLVPRHVSRTTLVDLSFPCARLGGLYREAKADGTSTQVGCQQAMALGRGPATAYEPVPEVDAQFDGRLTVYRALQQPGVFMVVPAQYLIGRVGAPGGGYQPAALWVQSFDAGTDSALPVSFHAELTPALTNADWLRLHAALDAISPNHVSRPLLATDPALGLLVDATTVSWGVAGIATTVDPDGSGGLRVAAAMTYSQAAVVLATMTTAGLDGIVGSARFTTGDATTTVATALRLTPHDLAGPAPQGAVASARDGATATLTNRDDAAARLRSVLTLDTAGTVRELPRADVLPPGGSISIDLGATNIIDVAADYDLEADAAVFAQRNVYIEDMHALVVVINDVWPAVAGAGATAIASIDLVATGAGAQANLPVTVAVPKVELTVVRPLNTADVAQARTLTLVATAHRADGSTTTSGAFRVDVSQTVLVELSRVLAAPPAT